MFFVGTGVPSHGAGGIGTYVGEYVRVCKWHVSFTTRVHE